MKTIIVISLCLLFALPVFSQNNLPIAVNDSTESISQVPVLIDVMSNDYDPDGESISIRSWYAPKHGMADTIGGKIRYKSNFYIGMDSLRYRIWNINNELSSYAWIFINVQENPNVPVAVADTFNSIELEPIKVNLLENDYDPDGDQIQINQISGNFNCAVSIGDDSSFVTVVPFLDVASGYFRYSVIEKNTSDKFISDRVTVRLLVSDNPDVPVPVDDEAQTTGGIPVTILVLFNDTDSQGDSLEIKSFTQPANGTVTQEGSNLVYIPAISFKGVDSFDYCVREINDTSIYSAYARVTIYVSKNPDCPVGIPDYANGMTFVPTTIEVLTNDTDINGDPFELMDVSSQTGGNVTVNGNLINYVSSTLAIGKDSLYYRIRQTNDTLYYSEWTPVYVDLAVNPDLPVAMSDFVNTRSGIMINISPLANDVKNSADSLILINVDYVWGTQKGKIQDKTDSTFNYIPYFNASGVDSFNYTILDKSNPILLARGKIFINITDQHFYDSLEINNINAGVNANGLLFSNIKELPVEGNYGGINAHFRFPANGNKHTIFTSSLWLGGLDSDDSLHLCAERYKSVGIDYQAGPVSDTYNSDYYVKYGRTWKISAAEVEYHRNNFWKEGYQPVEAISSWPGNGDPLKGEALQLAPYGDLNQDGIYNPLDGDYPLIRGDQTVFLMINDDFLHTESQGERFKLEVHAMIYAYDAPSDSVLNNTVLVHYDLINRSDRTYDETYAGIFTDLDLGNPYDDFIGCDVSRGSFYIYNGDQVDEDYLNPNNQDLTYGYGEDPPAQSVTILAGPFMDKDGLDNPSGNCDESINGLNFGNNIIDDERFGLNRFVYHNNISSNPATTDPNVAGEYYSYLKGIWKDQTPMLYGGNAHQASGAVGPECRFMFPGNSDSLNWGTGCEFPNGGYNQNGKFWTEEEAENNPGDRRGLGIMGPFTYKPGEVQEIELAFCASNGWEGPLSSFYQLMDNIDSLIFAVENGEVIIPNNDLEIHENRTNCIITISPNPSSSIIDIKLPLNSSDFLEYLIYDLTGTLRISGKDVADKALIINIQNLNSGFYVIKIKAGEGMFTGKFIKF